MKKPLMIILVGMISGSLLSVGLYIANFLEITPLGVSFNNFFIMVGVIIFLISGFFLLSMETLKK